MGVLTQKFGCRSIDRTRKPLPVGKPGPKGFSLISEELLRSCGKGLFAASARGEPRPGNAAQEDHQGFGLSLFKKIGGSPQQGLNS